MGGRYKVSVVDIESLSRFFQTAVQNYFYLSESRVDIQFEGEILSFQMLQVSSRCDLRGQRYGK